MACHAAVQAQNEPGYSLDAFAPGFRDRDDTSNIERLPSRTEALADALHFYAALHQRW
jgi:hypothetical protein